MSWEERIRRRGAWTSPSSFVSRDGTLPGDLLSLLQWRRRRAADAQHGKTSARWATFEDVRDYGYGISLDPSRDGRIYLGQFSEKRALIGQRRVDIFSHPDDNVLIEAPSGAGKTNLMELTMLRHLGPVIATSVRTDMLRHTIKERSQRGPVYIFAPGITDLPYPTDNWSPLQDINSWTDALKAADLLVASSDTNVKDHEKNKEYFNTQARIMLAPMLFTAAMVRELGPILQVDSKSADISDAEVLPSMSTIGEWVYGKNFRVANSILDNLTASSRGILDVIDGIRRGRTFDELQEETEQMVKGAEIRITEAKKVLPRSSDRSGRAEQIRGGIQDDLLDIRNTLLYPAQGRDAAIRHLMQLQRGELASELDRMEEEARSRISQARKAQSQLTAAFDFEREGETGAGAFGTVRSIIEPYNNAEAHIVRDMREIDIKRVLDENGTIYIIASDENRGKYRSMMQAFIGKSISVVQERNRRGEQSSSKVIYALDELAQFGLLKNLPEIVNTSRDSGYVVLAGIQSGSQLKQHYGDDAAATIEAGFKTKVVMGGGRDYRDISAAVGDTRVTSTSVNFDNDGRRTGRTQSRQSEPLVTTASFQSLEKGEAVVITGSFVAHTCYPKVQDVYPGMWN